jgi:GNAT superfamily N-acetyltransferase
MDPDAAHDETGLPIRPRPDRSDIRKASADERSAVAEALARGFHDDPIIAWVIPDPERRALELGSGFDLFARRIYFPRDEVYTTDHLAGAACWMPPGRTRVSVFEQLRMLPGMLASFRRELGRLVALLNAFEKRHPHEKEHWYLPVVAVKPEWQGRGFGAALLRPVLDRCDREGVPAYLEATSPRNRALYERHQFVVLEELRARADAPPAWPMWREPQPTAN